MIALIAVGAMGSSAIGAGQRPWAPRACIPADGAASTAARWSEPADLRDVRTEPWFRVDPDLDRRGELRGQRLALGVTGDRAVGLIELPAESFAAGPFGRAVLVGADDGSTSRLTIVDAGAGCSRNVAEESAVIRRATIDPTGTTIYEIRVDRATRDDLGVWARPVDGGVAAVRVLDPISPDERFGRTFATELGWDLAGRQLVVQSCGEAACRTRILDPVGGSLRTVADADLGVLVGLDGDDLVTYQACAGLPCPIVTTNLETGGRSTLVEEATVAVLVATPVGPRLVHEQSGEAGAGLRSVALDGSDREDVASLPDGLRLHPSGRAAAAATVIPPGWVLLSPDGRLPASGLADRVELRHVPDGAAVTFEEIAR